MRISGYKLSTLKKARLYLHVFSPAFSPFKDLKPLEPQPGQKTVKSFFEVSSDSEKASPLKKIGNTKLYLRKTAPHPNWRKAGEENDDGSGEQEEAMEVEEDVEVKKEEEGKEKPVEVKKETEVSGRGVEDSH